MYQVFQETDEDWWEVENLYDTTFGPGRVSLSSYRLRDGVDRVRELCFLARDDENILSGCIRYWPVRVGKHAALLLGPVAVHPTRQGEGLGGILLAHSLDAARESGWERVVLVGDLPYYQRFGFEKLEHIEMPPPTNPERVLGQELVKGAWDGIKGRVEGWIAPPHD